MNADEIKPGYRVTITTWENDADNYKLVIKDGLSFDEVKFIADLCTMHEGELGNMFEPSDEERDEYLSVLRTLATKNNASSFIEDLNQLADDFEFEDVMRDYLMELGFAGGDFYSRVVDSFTVHYIPTVIKLDNVTEQFM